MEYILNKKNLCKKSLASTDSNIHEGAYYEILRITKHHILISTDDSGFEVLSKDKKNSIVFWYFYDYFYTKKEERKEKLNQLLNAS